MGWSAQVEEGSHSCQYLSTPQWRQILSQELPCTSHQQHQRQGLSQHLRRLFIEFQLTEVSRVDGIKHSSMHRVESIRCINGQLLQLLPVVRVCSIIISIGPEPELGVGVEAVREHWHWIKTLDKVSDVLHLWFTEGSFSWPGLIAGVVTNTSF